MNGNHMSNAVVRKTLAVGAGGVAAGALTMTLNGPAAYLAPGGSNLATLANTVAGGDLRLQASLPPGGSGGGGGLTVQAGSGNVGVGTGASAAALDVSGSIRAATSAPPAPSSEARPRSRSSTHPTSA